MTSRRLFRTVSGAANVLLLVSILLVLCAAGWEYSTRTYLKGFSDAIVPAAANPIEKIETILGWMRTGPARPFTSAPAGVNLRDPENTLNYQALLRVCGTATNAFVNLANSTGLPARRLLLLGPDRLARHVVAEVYTDGRWIVVDAAFRVILRDRAGGPLTRDQLRDPAVSAEATAGIPGYNPSYNYLRTAHVRLSKIPLAGPAARFVLERVWRGWSDSIFWTMLLERESFAALVLASILFCCAVVLRQGLRFYGRRQLGEQPYRIRDQLTRLKWITRDEPRLREDDAGRMGPAT
jgi:hypothetical protein